jgi:ABC-type multidrug transport system fused ATPase/permease subunit
MTELVFGLGQPTHGQILWDRRALNAFEAGSLANLRAWIDPQGPLMAGTLFENLSPTNPARSVSDLVDATRKAGVYDAIDEFQETFSTFVSPDDDRLKGDALFRVGVARAILKQPSLVVAIEPSDSPDSDQRPELIDGLRVLANQGAVIFVVPRRGATLRNADQVVLLHDHKIIAIGKHSDLLEKHELYRHINYLLFSPYKQVVGDDV